MEKSAGVLCHVHDVSKTYRMGDVEVSALRGATMGMPDGPEK